MVMLPLAFSPGWKRFCVAQNKIQEIALRWVWFAVPLNPGSQDHNPDSPASLGRVSPLKWGGNSSCVRGVCEEAQ